MHDTEYREKVKKYKKTPRREHEMKTEFVFSVPHIA
jgi:hypothetical protein